MDLPKIALIVFTCQGKEHLLPACFSSFKKQCGYKFTKVIFGADGQVDPEVIRQINPDILVQNHERKGYIFNIINALALVDTEYFFWLEDDFNFEQPVPIARMIDVLARQEKWAGIFLSRSAPLAEHEKQGHHFDEFYIPDFGYSVSPTLCRTKHIRAAFEAMLNYPKTEGTKVYGFETFMKDYFEENGISYALMDPGNVPHVTHVGKLESTARSYHMINSLDKNLSVAGKEYISGFGSDRTITLTNKLTMIPKLAASFTSLFFRMFSSRKVYDYAFRVYLAYKNNFNN